MNIPLWKLFGWFRRPQLWATGDWQLHHNNMLAHVSRLVQSFFEKRQNHPGDSALLQRWFGALQLLACPKTKITFEREEILDHWWDSGKYKMGSWWQLGELCKVPRCLLWRGLRYHCPVYNVSCIFSKFLYFACYLAGYFLDRPHYTLWWSGIYPRGARYIQSVQYTILKD